MDMFIQYRNWLILAVLFAVSAIWISLTFRAAKKIDDGLGRYDEQNGGEST